jgi:hypothetical protein
MTTKYDKTARHAGAGVFATGKALSGESLAQSIASKINYLRNWRYYQPIFQCAGLNAPAAGTYGQIYPIYRSITKRDTANPERYFALVTDDFLYSEQADGFNELRWYDKVGASDYLQLQLIQYTGSPAGNHTGDYTLPPEAEYTRVYSGARKFVAGTWSPMKMTPAAEFEYGQVAYRGLAYRGMAMFEIPNPNLLEAQSGVALEETGKDEIIRGDVSPRNLETYGSLFDMIGDGTDAADSVEMATRRHWQWCHPFGVWMGYNASYPYVAATWYDMFAGLTVKFKPRKIFDDNRKVRVTLAAVISADAGSQIRITNTTHPTYTYTYTAPATYATATLVTMSAATTGLRVARGMQNHFKFELSFPTNSEAIKVHSLAIFEEDPFDSVA